MPKPRFERALGDVHQLHAAVGHSDHALPEDALAEDDVVGAQHVPDRLRLARKDDERDHRDEEDDAGGDPHPLLVQHEA